MGHTSVDWLITCIWIVDQASIGSVSAPVADKLRKGNFNSSWTTKTDGIRTIKSRGPFLAETTSASLATGISTAQKDKGQPVGLVRGKGKAYTLIVDQADASG